VSLAYQWRANGSAIGGATGKTFVPGFDQEDVAVSVTVTGSKASFATKTATSAAVTIASPSQLNNGEVLPSNKQLRSPNGAYALIMQGDGNLVQYGPSGAVWSTGTSGADHAVMQSDGNLVLYSSGGDARWGSGTDGYGAGVTLSLQDDGNLVLYRDGSAVWTRSVVRWLTVAANAMSSGTPGTQSMSGPTLLSTQYGIYAPGQRLPVVCGTPNGQGVKGAYSSTLDPTWHRLLGGDWVPDADFLTGTNGLFAGEPDCTPAGGGVGANKVDSYVAAHPAGTTVGTGQCVALVKDYVHAVFGQNPGAIGNAVDYQPGRTGGIFFAENGWVWHASQDFQEGDVLVWSQTVLSGGAINSYGHVAIWYKGDNPRYDQNGAGGALKIGFGKFFSGGGNVYAGYWRHA
jgi:hypothetical protein